MPGDDVILNGWGCGERRPGGYARARARAGRLADQAPAAFTNAETMAIGTAGYTAMLAVLALEAHGVTPDKGPVLVTGAAGGVGSVAVTLLAQARLSRHRLDGPSAGGGLPARARRLRDHRPR